MTWTSQWFAGLSCDHLYADCPSRKRGEATLRECGWWDMTPAMPIDPDGEFVCGMCLARYRRNAS